MKWAWGGLAIPVVAILAITGSLLSGSPASATSFPGTCPHGSRASTACLNNGTAMIGAYGTWHNNYMTMDPNRVNCCGDHLNQEMWVYTEQNESRWVETGLRNGRYPENPCNCQAYSVFWADYDNTAGGAGEIRHFIANVSPDETTHTYQVSHQCDGCAQWNVYYDGNFKGTSSHQLSGTSWDHQMGQENTYIFPGSHSDDFDMYGQYLTTGHVWKKWPAQNSVNDKPCGPNPNGYCMNGTSYGVANRWVNNKP